MKNICRICDSEKTTEVMLSSSHPRKMERERKYKYFFCNECGCLQEKEFPTNYNDIYTEDYGDFKAEDKNIKTRIWDAYKRYSISGKGIMGRLVSLIYKPIDYSFCRTNDINDRILDIGCGCGSFLQALRDNGYTNLMGCDPYMSKEINFEGFVLSKKDVFGIDNQEKFKLITLINVLEHLEDPGGVLKKLHNLLDKDGKIAIVLPVVNKFLWGKYGTSIWNLSPPEHLYIHTIESFFKLAQMYGFDVVDYKTECSSILDSDYKNMKDGRVELNTCRGVVQSIICGVKSIRFRKKIDSQKLGNQATFILQIKDK